MQNTSVIGEVTDAFSGPYGYGHTRVINGRPYLFTRINQVAENGTGYVTKVEAIDLEWCRIVHQFISVTTF